MSAPALARPVGPWQKAGMAFAAHLPLRLGASVFLLGTGLWGCLALWFRLPGPPALVTSVAAAWILVALATSAALWTGRFLPLGLYLVAFAALVGWFISIRATGRGDWAADVSRPVTAEFAGDQVTVRDVRTFAWRTQDEAEPGWETRSYDLSQIKGVDLINSYWMGPVIAHTVISFGFRDGRHLALSVEIRRRTGEAFSNVAGLFKRDELAFVAADERDMVLVRSNRRGEHVELFRLRVTPDQARRALVELLRRANRVAARPAFYNTITRNCTTEVFGAARTVAPGLPIDWRVVASGYLPDYAYDQGLLDTRVPLAELRRLGTITDRAKAANDAPDFSARIRQGVPDPNTGPATAPAPQ